MIMRGLAQKKGTDLMTGAPKNITERQVRDLRLRFAPKA